MCVVKCVIVPSVLTDVVGTHLALFNACVVVLKSTLGWLVLNESL